MQMQPMMAAYYPTNNVTTDHIQQVFHFFFYKNFFFDTLESTFYVFVLCKCFV